MCVSLLQARGRSHKRIDPTRAAVLSPWRGHSQPLLRCGVSIAVAVEVEAECSLLGRTVADRGRSCHMLDERCLEAELRDEELS